MIWQLKQKDVCFARSMWFSNPSRPAKTGKMKNDRNASIFPPRATVRLGRTATNPARTIVMTRTASIRVVGIMSPCLKTVSTSLFQAANVLDQRLDLIISQFAFKFRHFAFAFFGDLEQICIAFLGYIGRMEVSYSKFLPDGRAFAIGSVTDLALRFVQSFHIVGSGARSSLHPIKPTYSAASSFRFLLWYGHFRYIE